MQTFVCPDCHSAHCEPAEAPYVLAVRCSDCVLSLRYHEELAEKLAVLVLDDLAA
ncbi:MAG: hypothetical protein M3R53_09265 [Candidatus Eremiobacteraeota bacterium]|nr:hypothetical protein [Candidatus Eremiobacteraeota bacterium]